MIEPVRFENSQPLLIAGLRGHFSTATWQGIPAQWQRLASYSKIPGQVNSVGDGLCFQESDGIDYLTGFLVSSLKGLPAELFHSNIPAQTYAIFSHGEHVSKLRSTLDAIHEWCSASVYKPHRQLMGRRTSLNAMALAFIHRTAWAISKYGYRSIVKFKQVKFKQGSKDEQSKSAGGNP